MAKKRATHEVTPKHNPDGTLRGVAVEASDGYHAFLTTAALPAARKAARDGEVLPWVQVALDEFDRL